MFESIRDLLGRTWRKGTRHAINWLEEDGLDEPSAETDMAEGVEKAPYTAFESLSKTLPHLAYLEEEQVFLLESPPQLATRFNPARIEAVSFTLELTPLAGVAEGMRQSIKNVLIQCPPRTGIQWIVFGDPRIGPVLGHFASQSTNPLFQHGAQRRIEFWSKASTSVIFPGQPYRLRT